jgi:splicing factor 3B subunit 1
MPLWMPLLSASRRNRWDETPIPGRASDADAIPAGGGATPGATMGSATPMQGAATPFVFTPGITPMGGIELATPTPGHMAMRAHHDSRAVQHAVVGEGH